MNIDWQRLREIIYPTRLQLIGFPLVSAIGLFAVYATSLWSRYISNNPLTAIVNESDYGSQLAKLTDNGVGHYTVIFIFWSFIGLIAYTLFWSAANIIIEARNEVVVETSYTNKGSGLHRVRSIVWQLAAAAILIALVLLTATIILPLCLEYFGLFVTQALGLTPALYALGAIAILTVTSYVLWTLGLLVFFLA